MQVIVETHSDHVLNGIRLAVHGGQLPPESVALHFFDRNPQRDQTYSEVISPRINRDGRIDQWPEGFFDEWDKSLEALLGP
jgi:predicted ATPase